MDTLMSGAGQSMEWGAWEIIKTGGWYIMIPLVILSVIALYVFFERLMFLRKWCVYKVDFFNTIYELMRERDYDAVLKLCRKEENVFSSLVSRSLSIILSGDTSSASNSIDAAISYEIARVEKNLNILTAIYSIAPMVGFLGTVIGMVEVMRTIAAEGGFVDIGKMADGLFQALVTTVAGLSVAISAYFIKAYLITKIENIHLRMREIVSHMLKIAYESKFATKT